MSKDKDKKPPQGVLKVNLKPTRKQILAFLARQGNTGGGYTPPPSPMGIAQQRAGMEGGMGMPEMGMGMGMGPAPMPMDDMPMSMAQGPGVPVKGGQPVSPMEAMQQILGRG